MASLRFIAVFDPYAGRFPGARFHVRHVWGLEMLIDEKKAQTPLEFPEARWALLASISESSNARSWTQLFAVQSMPPPAANLSSNMMAGVEKLLMMGFPLHEIDIGPVSDTVLPATYFL